MKKHLVIKSKVKDIAEGMSVSSDYCDALNGKVKIIILESVIRAKSNGRKTVQARDL